MQNAYRCIPDTIIIRECIDKKRAWHVVDSTINGVDTFRVFLGFMPIKDASLFRNVFYKECAKILKECRTHPLTTKIRDLRNFEQRLYEAIESIPILLVLNGEDEFSITVLHTESGQGVGDNDLACPTLKVTIINIIRQTHVGSAFIG